MRLALKTNWIPSVIAAVSGPGFLNAHLNLSDRPKDNDCSKVIRIVGVQTLETETLHLKWPEIELRIGDTVELDLLEDGEGDAPSSVRRSSESPDNLFSKPELASEVLTAVSTFISQLMAILEKSRESESADEHKKFALATGYVLTGLDDSLLRPIHRRHKNLVPDERKGELL